MRVTVQWLVAALPRRATQSARTARPSPRDPAICKTRDALTLVKRDNARNHTTARPRPWCVDKPRNSLRRAADAPAAVRATFRAAKNRTALTDPGPCVLHAQILSGMAFSLCRWNGRQRRCSLQLSLQPQEARASPLASAPRGGWPPSPPPARLGCAARPLRHAPLSQIKLAAGRWRGCPVKLSCSQSAPRMACGDRPQRWAGSAWGVPHASAPARAHAAAVGAATRVDRVRGPCQHVRDSLNLVVTRVVSFRIRAQREIL